MAANLLSLLEIRDDKVHCVDGDDSEEIRSQFAREAEGLQLIGEQLGKILGTPRLRGCGISKDDAGLSFQFTEDAEEGVDARGIVASGESYTAASLIAATEAGKGGGG